MFSAQKATAVDPLGIPGTLLKSINLHWEAWTFRKSIIMTDTAQYPELHEKHLKTQWSSQMS